MTELSIIIPCYNEEKNLINLVNEIKIIKKENPELKLEFVLISGIIFILMFLILF